MSTATQLPAQAVAAAGDAIVTVSSDGVITSWNGAAQALLGHTAEQAIGQSLALIVPLLYRARHVGAFHTAMDHATLANGGRPARVEAMAADGSLVVLAMSLGVITEGTHGAAGAVAVLRPAGADLVPFVSPS
jgi:PAS domain S-box-containing protein